MHPSRISIPHLFAKKAKGEKIVCLTAYTAPFARALDGVADVLLVGDSLGMVLYGMESTLGVTVDMMLAHGLAVVKASKASMVVVDMPFGSYQASKEQAFTEAARIMAETGCTAVKLEGGSEMAETIHFLTRRGIPVMGHIGLMPQHMHSLGGFRYQGRSEKEAIALKEHAKAVEEAGAFAVVLEGIAEPVAAEIVAKSSIITIGIGASPACDGQVMVAEDMCGLFGEFTPKFVKHYASLGEDLANAARRYAEEVRAGSFPDKSHCFFNSK